QVGGPYSRVDDLLAWLADGHRYGLALHRLLLALDLDYLPVARRHEVLGDEERSPIVNADAPVEVARQPFLRDEELRLVEEALGFLAQALFGLDLHHVEAEAAVGQLEHAGQPERRHD